MPDEFVEQEIPANGLPDACEEYGIPPILVSYRAWDVIAETSGFRAGLLAAAPIIIADYIRQHLIPDDDQDGTEAWLAMHARSLDPEGDHA